MKISHLIPTQHSLRDFSVLPEMTRFVTDGGVFNHNTLSSFNKDSNRGSSLISLNQFEDGKIYIQDGHHRITSIHLDHRDFLYPEEFKLERWTYDHYTELSERSISSGWLTPFDPRTEIRHPEFHSFKTKVPQEPKEALNFIKCAWENGLYCKKRENILTVKDIINKNHENIF